MQRTQRIRHARRWRATAQGAPRLASGSGASSGRRRMELQVNASVLRRPLDRRIETYRGAHGRASYALAEVIATLRPVHLAYRHTDRLHAHLGSKRIERRTRQWMDRRPSRGIPRLRRRSPSPSLVRKATLPHTTHTQIRNYYTLYTKRYTVPARSTN